MRDLILLACALLVATLGVIMCQEAYELESLKLEKRIEQRFMLKKDLDDLLVQANAVIQAHAAAIRELQERLPQEKSNKGK